MLTMSQCVEIAFSVKEPDRTQLNSLDAIRLSLIEFSVYVVDIHREMDFLHLDDVRQFQQMFCEDRYRNNIFMQLLSVIERVSSIYHDIDGISADRDIMFQRAMMIVSYVVMENQHLLIHPPNQVMAMHHKFVSRDLDVQSRIAVSGLTQVRDEMEAWKRKMAEESESKFKRLI